MTFEEINSILKNENILPDSSFGQNFLCNEEIISNIACLADIKKTDKVLEIGPGIGSLTNALCDLSDNVTCVEIDKRLADFLKNTYSGRAEIIIADFLKLKDYGASEFDVVVSNLPYYIMTDIMKKIISECTGTGRLVFMVEDIAIGRITAKPNTKQYGPLSVLCSLYGDVKREFTVPRDAFIPRPNTTSAVITIKNNDFKGSHEFTSFVEKCFSQRRKKLVNSCPESAPYLEELGLNDNVRAQEMKPESFVSLYNAIIN